jgi:pyridinium-3,5-bisthiocarboxylic acid mononucleotide nickel chelatase
VRFDGEERVPYDEKSVVGRSSFAVRGWPKTDIFVLLSLAMRIAYLDCFSGISGDMFLGALVDAGVSARLLEETAAALKIGARVEISRVDRSGISATKVDVSAGDETDRAREPAGHEHHHLPRPQHESEHHESGHHGHEHHPHQPVPGEASRPLPHEHAPGPTRGLKEIGEIIGRAGIGETAKKTAIRIFGALGEAEAKIHNLDIEKIHFHEVGAVDAMVDIVCSAVGREALGVDEIVCSPLNVGGGMVQCAHGTFPVPTPATLELLKGAPVYSSGLQAELVTPTGAAIVKTLAARFDSFPEMTIERTGYGAGSRNLPGHANVVRLTVGEARPELAAKTLQEIITVLEANLDDLNPQVFGYVMDRLLEDGALDVFGMPVQMKKSRPGMLLTVLCKPEHAEKLTGIIFTESSTLGVRRREETRLVLARKFVSVGTEWGEVRMKIASMNGTVTNCAPEYEDCRRIAAEQRVPLKTVMNRVMEEYLRGHKG